MNLAHRDRGRIARDNQRAGEAERLAVADWYTRAGLIVLNMSQPGLPRGKRGSRGTFMATGIPDLLVIDPRWPADGCTGQVGVFWHEVKSGKAALSADQVAVHGHLIRGGMLVVVGDREAAKAELRRRGLLVPMGAGEGLRPVGVHRG